MAAEWHLGSRGEVGAPREWSWFMNVVLLSGESWAMPGTSEQKLGASRHCGVHRRPLPSASRSLCLCTIKTDKKGLTAEFQAERFMQLMHIS